MQKPNDVSSPREGTSQLVPVQTPLSGRALERRRALLKGLSGGSALVAAAVPIKSLANSTSVTANGKMCTVSGVGSSTHSFTGQQSVCGGMSPGYYKTPSHWPNYSATTNQSVFNVDLPNGNTFQVTETFPDGNGSSPGNSSTDPSFSSIFGSGSGNGLFFIMKNEAPTDEFHWIAALLNAVFYATTGSWPLPSKVFPYTPKEIISLYQGNNRAAALAFLKSYLEQH